MGKFVYNTSTIDIDIKDVEKCAKMAKNCQNFFNVSLTASVLKDRIIDLTSVLKCMENNYNVVSKLLTKLNEDITSYDTNSMLVGNGVADTDNAIYKQVSEDLKYGKPDFLLSTESMFGVKDTKSNDVGFNPGKTDEDEKDKISETGDGIYKKPVIVSEEPEKPDNAENTGEVIDGTIDIPNSVVKIPSDIKQAGIGNDYTQNYGTRKWSYDQKKMRNAWSNAGGKTDGNLATINGRYLVACTSTYGKVGDNIDITLEDGTVIHAVIADEKAQEYCDWDHNPADKWGHEKGNGRSIIEWEVCGTSWNSINSNLHDKGWYGKDVVSVSNMGSGNYF